MQNTRLKQGEVLMDIVFNTTGLLSNYNSTLSVNGYNTWSPKIAEKTDLIIDDTKINNFNVTQLEKYKFSLNLVQQSLFDSIDVLEQILKDKIIDSNIYEPVNEVIEISFTAKQGEQLIDIVFNESGALSNYEKCLDSNTFSTWSPILSQGNVIKDFEKTLQTNILFNLQNYKFSSTFVNENLLNEINELEEILIRPIKLFSDYEPFKFSDNELYEFNIVQQ